MSILAQAELGRGAVAHSPRAIGVVHDGAVEEGAIHGFTVGPVGEVSGRAIRPLVHALRHRVTQANVVLGARQAREV